MATTPLPGTAIAIGKVPGNVQSLRAQDLMRDGAASLTSALDSRLGSININDSLADPFQPDILFRGFEASPVLGTPQGVAVYQNGVRINEAFGDAVNWDLIPDIAIDRVDIVGTNPVYGLNALGGAAAITMKNAFSYRGGEAELSGGSFDQRQGSAQIGADDGMLGVYAAGRVLDQDGWRLFAHDLVRQMYLDFSLRRPGVAVDLSYEHAANRLFGQGAAPVQELAISRELVFTGPQDNLNTLDFVTLNASYKTNDTLSLQGVLYYRSYGLSIANGNTTNYTACTTPRAAGLLCQPDGATPLTNAAGTALSDISRGGTVPIGENDFEMIHAVSRGGSLQFNQTAALFGRGNQLSAGVSVDSERVDFHSGTQIGVIDPALTVLPSDLIVDTPESSPFSATPVDLIATNRDYGFFATDAFDLSDALTLTVSGRYNVAQIDLADQLGTSLSGENRFTHFNPAVGATYALSSGMTAYAGWSVNNRAPTASEIECSDPRRPCLLPSDLAGDPPNLKQVVAHTLEVGLRGRLVSQSGARSLEWSVGLFRTDLESDIYGVATSLSSGFFQNIGATRRQGLEAGLDYRAERWSTSVSYGYVDATFRSSLSLSSPSNPFQDANGDIRVVPGDRLPGIPLHRLKAEVDYRILPRWSLGGTLTVVSDQYYHGDESNQNAPLPGYHVVSLHSTYRASDAIELFVSIHNLLDARYATYGIYSDPTAVGAPGIPPGAAANAPGVDNRFQSPAAPPAVFGGVRVRF